MKKQLLLLLIFSISLYVQGQNIHKLASPDGNIQISVNLSDKIYYDVICRNETLLKQCHLAMEIGDQELGTNPKMTKVSHKNIDESLKPVIPLKFSSVSNRYNQLLLDFKGGYSVEFRAFNDGIAYRFITNKKGMINVKNETLQVNFPDNYLLHMQQSGSFKTAYEEEYTHLYSKEWKSSASMALLPILIDTQKGSKILISETSLTDYPAVFLKSNGSNGMVSVFPKVPLEFGEDGDRSVKILKEADYIAQTSGKRNFPWRYFVISTEDSQLIENTMSYRLAEKNILEDTSWIKPGLASWEWWNGATPYGPDVNFVAGCNLDTYKYFIDFAANYGIPYIIMDDVYGDVALKVLSEGMQKFFDKNVLLGRNGGDEFCIFLPDCTCADVKEKLEEFTKLKRSFKYDGEEHQFTISVGYAEYPVHADKPSKLMRCADTALYEVKLRGKNGCMAYKNGLRMEIRTQLGFALKDVSENLPGAFIIYKADKNDDEILFANREFIRFAGCKNMDELLEYTKRSFRNIIKVDEREAVIADIWKQIDEGHTNGYTHFNMLKADGGHIQVFDHGRIVENGRYGRVIYALITNLEIVRENYGNSECNN